MAELLQQWEHFVEIAIGDRSLAQNRGSDRSIIGHVVVDGADELAIPFETDPPQRDCQSTHGPKGRECGGLSGQGPPYCRLIVGNPSRLADHHLAQKVGEEEALSLTGIRQVRDLFGTEVLRERSEQLIDRGSLLGAGSEVEPAQRCVRVIARRLENLIEEIEHRSLERGDLAWEAEHEHPGSWRWLLLQAVGQLLVQSLYEKVVLGGRFPYHVASAVLGLKGVPPYHAAGGLAEASERFHEAGDQVGFREQCIDRKVHLEVLVELREALSNRARMSPDLFG